jgi:opacity protein-like surface antigen
MKKKFLQLFISLLFTIAADAKAKQMPAKDICCADMVNVYAKLFGGANFLQDTSISGNNATYHTGYVFAGSLGYCWRYGLHWEAEYAFRRNGIKEIDFFTEGNSNHGHFQTSSYMANMLWYVPLSTWGYGCWNFRPLIGLGVGYDFERMTASNSRIVFNQKWHVFSWQAIAGFAYTIFCNTELTLEYKFHQGDNFYNNAIGVGLAYKFGVK